MNILQQIFKDHYEEMIYSLHPRSSVVENVTFHYNRHEDGVYVEETIPAMEFIERLIRHIPEKHFKMIRYGGIYARNRNNDFSLDTGKYQSI